MVRIKKDILFTDLVSLTHPLDQMLQGDSYFFLNAVMVQENHFAPVDHSRRHGFYGIGRKNKVAIGQINIHGRHGVFVVKEMILFRIQDLQKG